MSFKIGDLVKLKSGSELMTVSGLITSTPTVSDTADASKSDASILRTLVLEGLNGGKETERPILCTWFCHGESRFHDVRCHQDALVQVFPPKFEIAAFSDKQPSSDRA